MDRDQTLRRRLAERISPRLAPPRENQVSRNAMPARYVRNLCSRRNTLLDDPRLLIVRPTAATLDAIQNLNPHRPEPLSAHAFQISLNKQGGPHQRDTR
jgi:hypothetical protein